MNKILIATTDDATCENLKQLIAQSDYSVLTSKNRADTFQIFSAEQPNIVVVDHPLGKEHGVDILKDLLKMDPTCEVILVTSNGAIEDAIEVLRAGALDYLQKPIDTDRVRVALNRAQERRKQKLLASETPSILVMEDHEQTLKRLVNILRKEGYNVHAASNGEKGMEIFQNTRLDLILSDIRMPRKDGLDVLRETKGNGADVEVIVITGHGDEEIVVEALREGAINFLRKPVDIEQMLLAIQKALEYQTMRRSLAYRNRDVEWMQELVVRLTTKLELIVETPKVISRQAQEFLHQLIDALPLGIVVVDSLRHILYANSHIIKTTGAPPNKLEVDWLTRMGVNNVTDELLNSTFDQVLNSIPGSIETLAVSKWSFVVMTPLKLIRPDNSEKYVAVAIRGERNPSRPIPEKKPE